MRGAGLRGCRIRAPLGGARPGPARPRIRLRAVQMVAPQGFGYLGQALSSAEEVAALFAVARPGVDRIVCSPGHYVIAFYAAAAEVGLLPGGDAGLLRAGRRRHWRRSALSGRQSWTTCAGRWARACPRRPGFALSDRLRGRDTRTFALVSDGELEEGQVWEAAMFAAHHRLSAADRAAGRQQLPGRRAGGRGHHDRADRGQVGRVRLGHGRGGRARRGRGQPRR